MGNQALKVKLKAKDPVLATPSPRVKIFVVILCVLVSAFVFSRVLHFEFVNYDDPDILLKNKAVINFDLKSIISEQNAADYIPLTLLTYALEYKAVGFDPALYHLTNLLLHILNCIFVFILLFKLTGQRKIPTFAGGLLFLAHPLHVESVAWVTERKDVLCTLFSLISLFFYFKYEKGKARFLVFSLISFILALMSKSMALTIPFVFFLWDYQKGRKLNLSSVLVKLPFILLSIGTVILHFYLHSSKVHLESKAFNITVPFINFFNSTVFYISKSVLPLSLSPFYKMGLAQLANYQYVIAVFILTLSIGFAYRLPQRRKEIIFGLWFFFITMAPISQVMPFGNNFAYAERYFYVPGIGLLLIYGVFIEIFWSKLTGVLLGVIALTFMAMSFDRTLVWQNSETLWSDARDKYPALPLAHFNLGGYYFFDKGQNEKALDEYDKTLELDPNDAPTHFNKGLVYNKMGLTGRAIQEFSTTVSLAPNVAQAHYNLGVLYALIGYLSEASDHLRKALELDPQNQATRDALKSLNEKIQKTH